MPTTKELRIALDESVKLQSHYAQLLNIYDGGKRLSFVNTQAWITRLYEVGKLPSCWPGGRRRNDG